MDRKGQLMEVMADKRCHAVIIVDTYHIGIEARYRRMFRTFSVSGKFNVMYQPFHISLDFFKGFFPDMALHYKLWLMFTAMVDRFHAESEKLRIRFFQVHDF